MFVGEVWLTIFAVIAISPVLLDLWAYTFTEIGARMEHGVAIAILWPLEQARELGFLSKPGSHVPLTIPLALAAAFAAALTALAALIDPQPGTRPTLIRSIASVPCGASTRPRPRCATRAPCSPTWAGYSRRARASTA